MRIPKLDNRLACIYDMIGDAKSVCDVGADHGRLALNLAKAGKRVIATDISGPSLKKTTRLIKLHGADVDCRLGDGLTVISPGEVKVCVMAGMGQGTMIKIIKESRKVIDACEFIVLQSMNGEYDLRAFLSDEGFDIREERVEREGKRIYCVIKAAPANGRKLTESEKHFGSYLLENRETAGAEEYFERNIAILKEIVSGMESAGDTTGTRYVKIIKALDDMGWMNES